MTNQKYKTYYHARGNYIIKTTTKRNKVINIDRVVIDNSVVLFEEEGYFNFIKDRVKFLPY